MTSDIKIYLHGSMSYYKHNMQTIICDVCHGVHSFVIFFLISSIKRDNPNLATIQLLGGTFLQFLFRSCLSFFFVLVFTICLFSYFCFQSVWLSHRLQHFTLSQYPLLWWAWAATQRGGGIVRLVGSGAIWGGVQGGHGHPWPGCGHP